VIVRRNDGEEIRLADGGNRYDYQSAGRTIAWLDAQTGQVRREIVIPESEVNSLAFSPDGQAIAAGILLYHPERGIIRIFRLRDKREIQTIESPCPWVEALSFTPSSKQIVAGRMDSSIVIWDVHSTD